MKTFKVVFLLDSGKLEHDIDPVKQYAFVQAESRDAALHEGDKIASRWVDDSPTRAIELINWYAFPVTDPVVAPADV